MTSETFCDKFRPLLLGLMAEAYCFRKLPPSEFGMLMDAQHQRLQAVLRQMYNALTPDAQPLRPAAAPAAGQRTAPSTNGHKTNAAVA